MGVVEMNVVVRDKRVDPMFVKLASVHGLNAVAREHAEKVVPFRRKPVEEGPVEPPQDILVALCSSAISIKRDWLVIQNSKPKAPLVKEIIAVVAQETGVSTHDILSPRRSEKVVLARHIAMYLAKTLTAHSFPDLGKLFGGKDHTTVLHAVERISKLLDTSENASALVRTVRAKLEGGN